MKQKRDACSGVAFLFARCAGLPRAPFFKAFGNELGQVIAHANNLVATAAIVATATRFATLVTLVTYWLGFGLRLLSRPVAVTAWLKSVWTRPVSASTSCGSASM